MVRVVGNTDAPPPTVTDFGSNPDAVIGRGLTVGLPDTPVPAHAGPAQVRPIADTASAPSTRNFLMHHPPSRCCRRFTPQAFVTAQGSESKWLPSTSDWTRQTNGVARAVV